MFIATAVGFFIRFELYSMNLHVWRGYPFEAHRREFVKNAKGEYRVSNLWPDQHSVFNASHPRK